MWYEVQSFRMFNIFDTWMISCTPKSNETEEETTIEGAATKKNELKQYNKQKLKFSMQILIFPCNLFSVIILSVAIFLPLSVLWILCLFSLYFISFFLIPLWAFLFQHTQYGACLIKRRLVTVSVVSLIPLNSLLRY